jgi:hypothetical protein
MTMRPAIAHRTALALAANFALAVSTAVRPAIRRTAATLALAVQLPARPAIRRAAALAGLALTALAPARPAAAQSRVAVVELTPLPAAGAAGWLPLGAEPEPDGRFGPLPDLRELQVRYDPGERRVWFRLVLHQEPPADWFGLNLALDTDGDPATGTAWWNVNKEFRFDRLVTVWLNRTGAVYEGAAGVADTAGAGRFAMDNLGADLRVARDPEGRSLAVGVPLALLGGGTIDLIATAGSSFAANDDLPDKGSIRLDLGKLARGEGEAPAQKPSGKPWSVRRLSRSPHFACTIVRALRVGSGEGGRQSPKARHRLHRGRFRFLGSVGADLSGSRPLRGRGEIRDDRALDRGAAPLRGSSRLRRGVHPYHQCPTGDTTREP